MQAKRGYYEVSKTGDFFGLPVTVFPGNVMYNGRHWHDHVELILCKKGCTHIKVEQEDYTLYPGDFITIGNGISHEIYGGKKGNLQIICSVEYDALGDMKQKQIICSTVQNCELLESDRNLLTQALEEMAVLSILDQSDTGIVNVMSDREARENLLKVHPLGKEENWFRYHWYLYQLLMVLVKYKRETEERNDKKWYAVNDCVRYIHEHLGDTLNAEILAGQLHVSQPTIYRLFSEQIGMPLGEYITGVRVNAACRYLESTEEKVIDIAYACGFTGLSNFYRVFQSHVGISPGTYRETHRVVTGQVMIGQPDIMKLNQFQNFYELGYDKESLRSVDFQN